MKRCGFGFDCSAMFLQPGLLADDCPNRAVCKTLPELPTNTQTWFNRNRINEGDRIRERIALTSIEAATLMLLMRGAPETPQSLGTIAAIDLLQQTLSQVRSHLISYGDTTYIAPLNTETHPYNVKRPGGTYTYNKLAATDAIFEPAAEPHKVKVIHLSHDSDPRNQIARAGIERRNKLLQLTNKITAIEQTISSVLADLISIELEQYD